MSKIRIIKRIFLVGFILLIIAVSSLIFLIKNSIKGVETSSEINNQSVNSNEEKPKSFIYYNKTTNEEKTSVNVLLLGLDGRVGDNRPRCDGIHMISFLEEDNKIIITSIPRGIVLDLPGIATESAYIGNSCHIKGIDYAIGEIERITEIHPDYLVTAGFSQVKGILRLLNLPTTSTLQFLRNRRYGLGDFQRSHNQALFIKDMFINNFEKVMSIPKPLRYVIYSLFDTNIDYNKASDILDKIQKSGLYKNPDNVILSIKPEPYYTLAEIHFNPDDTDTTQAEDQEFQEYQNQISASITNILQNADYYFTNNNKAAVLQTITTPFKQKIWEQVEDENFRNETHFHFLKLFVLSSSESSSNITLVKDFIEQMELYNDQENKQKGEELLDSLN